MRKTIRILLCLIGASLGMLVLSLLLPSGRAAPDGKASFGPGSVITDTADGAWSVYAADVDGDGDMDILSASENDNKIAWYENDGGAESEVTFSSHTITTTADGARAVYAADVDNDGDMDVLSTSALSNEIVWHENDGESPPAFISHVITTTADGARAVYAADVDSDGDIDILSASPYNDEVAWYENDGASHPSFTSHVITTAADGAHSVYVADVDGDGDMDILSAAWASGEVAWYENDGDVGGTLAFSTHIITTTNGASSVYATDVDRDGDMDILSASAYSDTIAWYENDGETSPSFTDHIITTMADGAISVYAADMDNDGDVDVMSASRDDNAVTWYENDGAPSPTFASQLITSTADGGGHSVYATDVDGDGDMDILSASAENDKIAWYPNHTIHRSATYPVQAHTGITNTLLGTREVFVADVDNDGDMDILSASYDDHKIAWYENNGNHPPTFNNHVIAIADYTVNSVYAADVDSDGDIDVLTSVYDGSIIWYENDGNSPPTFSGHEIDTNVAYAYSVRAADMDGDGDVDVLSAPWYCGSLAWYENDGQSNPNFTINVIPTTFVYQDGIPIIHLTDLDGDGDVDILAGSHWGAAIVWYENDGNSSPFFAEHIITSSIDGVYSVYAADLDGDGDQDALSASWYDDKIAWYENSGGSSPVFASRIITDAAINATSVYAADMDNDGDVDILSASVGENKIAWYENDGGSDPVFSSHVITTDVADAHSVHAADMDNDGDMDALSTSNGDEQIIWYENRGGQFALATSDTAPATINSGQMDDLLRIMATHRGRAGDTDAELVTLELLFEESAGNPLSTVQANALIENLHVYRDDGSGDFDQGTDTLVTTVGALALTTGTQTVTFADGDSYARLAFGTPLTYFVVTELTGDAASQTPNQFQVTHLTAGEWGAENRKSIAENRDHDLPLTLEYAANGSSGIIIAERAVSLTSIAPPRNAVTATLNTTISATYDQPINPTTVTSRTFAVHGMQSGLVTAVHGVANAGNTIIVTPTRPFHQGELVYAIATTRTLNISGTGPLSGTLWQFNAGEVRERCVAGFTEVYAGSLTGVDGSAAWGDYDNDGDLDILLTGLDDSTPIAKMYQNTGSHGSSSGDGFSEVYAGSLTGVQNGSMAWGDYDNDGDLDILLTGYAGSIRHAKVYQNTGNGFSEVYTGSLTGVHYGSVAWGDYDNDGDLDILLTGRSDGPIAKVYRNTGSHGSSSGGHGSPSGGGFSEVYAGSLTGVSWSSVGWGDYDNDGDLDILLTGYDGSARIAKVYQNTGSHVSPPGGGFDEVYVGSLTGVSDGSVAWGDYDNDGDLDILLTGSDGSAPIAKVYQNTGSHGSPSGSGFSEVYAGSLTSVWVSSVAWGDYDNDGDLDILLTGSDGGAAIAKVYQNTGSHGSPSGDGFSEVYAGRLTGVFNSSVAWGDYDNDGDLDILLTGDTDGGPITRMYRNDDCLAPTPPTISDILNQSTAMGAAVGPLPFTVADAETDAGTLALAGASSNASLVPPANIVFGGGGTNRSVTVTPAAGLTGTATITITVSDGELAAHDAFVLAVGVNSLPQFTSTPLETANVGQPYVYSVATSDADAGDALTITAPTLPGWLTLAKTSTRTAALSGTPDTAGDYATVLHVTDGEDGDTQSFTITVASACTPLTGVSISGPSSGYTGTLYNFSSVVTPADASTPVAYAWSPAPASGQGTASASYTWDTPGAHTVTLTAENCAPPSTVIVSNTHTITLGDSPPAGDDYEVDDTCAQAQHILTDGSIQSHNFHAPGDEDWIAFQATAGTQYLVEAITPSDSNADVSLEVYAACGNVPTDTQDHAFSPDVRLLFTAPYSAMLYLRYSNSHPDIAGPDIVYELSVRALAETATPGVLVLVAGRLRLDDTLQRNIHNVTNDVYNLFLAHDYGKDRIYYLATNQGLDPDSNGLPDDVDAQPNRANLENVITQWAADPQRGLGPDRSFTLYMMDHGGKDRFYLNGSSETVTPDELDAWLSTLEAARPGVRVNVIMDACHSGSFVDSLGETNLSGSRFSRRGRRPGDEARRFTNALGNAGDRVVIASTASHALAYASQDGAVFSDAFLDGLERGLSLYNSFEQASWFAQKAHPGQVPWIDDSGDGNPNRTDDGQEAARRGFAYAGTFPDEQWPPYVVWAQVTDVQDGDGVIEAEVRDDTSVNHVWVVVYKPSYTPPDPDETEEMPQEHLPKVYLEDTSGGGIYSGLYEGFDEIGEYRLVIYAADNDDLKARPKEVLVRAGWGVYLPLVIKR